MRIIFSCTFFPPHFHLISFMVYFNCTSILFILYVNGPLTLCTPFILLRCAFHILGPLFPTSIFLLGGNVLEIMLKNIFEYLKFNIFNILYHCSWIALSRIAVWIHGGGGVESVSPRIIILFLRIMENKLSVSSMSQLLVYF